MKNISKLLRMSVFFSFTLLFAATAIQAAMNPDEVKAHLLKKYSGKLNGIQKLARESGDSVTAAEAATIRGKIDAAVNQAIGMGAVDISSIENSIEKSIYTLLTRIFKQSIPVAKRTARNEVTNNLFAISPWNKKLIWNPAKTHVLMLTWIPANRKGAYENALKSGNPLKIEWDAWVTAVPQVKEFAKNYIATEKSGFNLTDRIEQYLGLLPSSPPYSVSQNKLFIEMWVRPQDLERPCLDAEIIDGSCMYDPDESESAKLPPAFRDMSQLIPMTNEHKTWYNAEKKSKYTGDWAMPWTRFGYTYDWGSSKKSAGKLAAGGASEYKIKRDSVIIVNDIISTDAYPNTPNPKSGYIFQE